MQLFWAKGYGSTSVSDLLQASGVNSGSLYHFFPGKQDLLLAVLERYREGIGEMLLAPAWQGRRRPDRARVRVARPLPGRDRETDCTYGCPIGSLALEIHEPDPPVRAALAANFDAWTAAIEECLVAAGTALARGARPPRTRGVRADDDGRRRDAGAHASRRRVLRPLRTLSSARTSTSLSVTPGGPGRRRTGRPARGGPRKMLRAVGSHDALARMPQVHCSPISVSTPDPRGASCDT